jgi:hypothetical protein
MMLEILRRDRTYLDGALDSVLVTQKTASLVSVVVVVSVDVQVSLDVDVQVCSTLTEMSLCVSDVVGVDLGTGLDFSHQLVRVVVAKASLEEMSMVEVVNLNIGSSIN